MIYDPDGESIRRAKAGDKAAFGKLVEKYYEMIYGLAYGVVNHQEAARDAAQEVFLKAFREIGKFRGQSKFKTWLYRIAVNAAIDEGRRRRPLESIDATDAAREEGDEPPLVIRDPGPGPRDRAAQNELNELMGRALDQLTSEHRAVLVLREWQGLSYEEIAETLEIEFGTVMSRLFYARKKLAGILERLMGRKQSA